VEVEFASDNRLGLEGNLAARIDFAVSTLGTLSGQLLAVSAVTAKLFRDEHSRILKVSSQTDVSGKTLWAA
jgi:hypothetical protein